jgi:hypothetical protein
LQQQLAQEELETIQEPLEAQVEQQLLQSEE